MCGWGNPLLESELYDAECNQIENRATMDWGGDDITIGFQPVPHNLFDICNNQVVAGPIYSMIPEIVQPKFCPRMDTGSTEFDFHTKIEWLSFRLNDGKDAYSSWEQQSYFINQICDSKEVFFLQDKDLDYCDDWKYTILTMMDRSVYLPHCPIPKQL